MTQYNLLKDCYINTLTTSGTGDMLLTQAELLALYDSDISTVSIPILSHNTLCLEVTLYRRIRLSGVFLYMDVAGERLSALSNINFYYSDDDLGEYQLLDKFVNESYFYVVHGLDIFAPKRLKITISGIATALYELEVLNYDYNLIFGTDGSMVEKHIFTSDEYSTISIYNNSSNTVPATAYVAIDPGSGAMSQYVGLSTAPDGEYVTVFDTIVGIGLVNDHTYNFNFGSFDNTESDVGGTCVYLTDTSWVGTYTTPILYIGDSTAPAFFNTIRTLPSNAIISHKGINNYASMKVRSSNTEPVGFSRLYRTFKPSTTAFSLQECDILNKLNMRLTAFNYDVEPWTNSETYRRVYRVLFDTTSYELVLYIYDTEDSDYGILCRYDILSNTTTYVISRSSTFKLTSTDARKRHLTIDSTGKTWLYNGSGLYVFSKTLSYTDLSSLNTTSSNYIHTISGSKIFGYCWYTDQTSKRLVCVDESGNTIVSISLSSPTYLCALRDGGCSVIDSGVYKIYRYSAIGEELSSCSFSASYDIVDFKEVLIDNYSNIYYWLLLSNGVLLKIKENGEVVGQITVIGAYALTEFQDGVIVYCSQVNETYHIDNSCNLVYTWDDSAYSYRSAIGAVVNYSYTDLLNTSHNQFLTLIDDPVWSDQIDNWTEVKMDNSFFGGKKYYQLQFQLHGGDPEISNISIETTTTSGAGQITTITLDDVLTGDYFEFKVDDFFYQYYGFNPNDNCLSFSTSKWYSNYINSGQGLFEELHPGYKFYIPSSITGNTYNYIHSRMLLVGDYSITIYGEIINTDYEGSGLEIKATFFDSSYHYYIKAGFFSSSNKFYSYSYNTNISSSSAYRYSNKFALRLVRIGVALYTYYDDGQTGLFTNPGSITNAISSVIDRPVEVTVGLWASNSIVTNQSVILERVVLDYCDGLLWNPYYAILTTEHITATMANDIAFYSNLSTSYTPSTVTISGNTPFVIDDVMSSRFGIESPVLNSAYFSKSLKLTDIYPKEYKDVYIKTDFPEFCEEDSYDLDLRCWWDRRED